MKFYFNRPVDNNFNFPYCVLKANGWNDWGFLTTFSLFCYLEDGYKLELGNVKIGKKGMSLPIDYQNTIRTHLDNEFNFLDDQYFSVGDSEYYYKQFYELGKKNLDVKNNVLEGLNDIVQNIDIYNNNMNEDTMRNSLMRSSSVKTIKDVYYKVLTTGKEELIPYNFSVTLKNEINNQKMSFLVSPDGLPQSNIHTLIGRNGVGKTHFFKSIISKLSDSEKDEELNIIENFEGIDKISSVLAISYSIFDTTLPKKDIFGSIPYRFIGFTKKIDIFKDQSLNGKTDLKSQSLQSIMENFICDEFIESVTYLQNHKFLNELVRKCINTLNSDPVFQSLNVHGWMSVEIPIEDTRNTFNKLSSGHKVVLLTLFKLIINIEANSVVLIDEPEQNLHPPLISSFVQAILNILKERNAMAIIATHSPVIVQECSADSTWILNRSEKSIKIDRPTIKTFGANVGEITYDVFDLEVEKSGYMKVISDIVDDSNTFEEVINRFDDKVGSESEKIISSIIYQREADDEWI